MSNQPSYCELFDAKIRASEKDLPAVVADYHYCLILEGIFSAKKLDSKSQITIVPCYHNPNLKQ